MKCKFLTAAVFLLMVIMVFVGALSTFATGEEVPTEGTLAPTETPTETVPVTGTENPSLSVPSDTVGSDPTSSESLSDPTGETSSTVPTESTVPVSRPTEFADSQPEDQTHSPYYATNSPIQAPSYNANAQNWGHIDYDEIGLNNEAQSGKIDFSGVQKDTSSEDKRSYFFTNIAVVLMGVAVIGITVFVFTFVYEANQKSNQKKADNSVGGNTSDEKVVRRRRANHYRR